MPVVGFNIAISRIDLGSAKFSMSDNAFHEKAGQCQVRPRCEKEVSWPFEIVFCH
jgi:hypothetical protein